MVLDTVEGISEFERRDAAAIAHVDTIGAVRPQQHVLEAPAVELKGGHRRKPRWSELEAQIDPVIAVRREEVPQPELLELGVPKVRLQAQHVLKIVRPDFDAGIADLERRFRYRVATLFHDQDAQRRS